MTVPAGEAGGDGGRDAFGEGRAEALADGVLPAG
jgi:hypothetical protein